MKTAKLLGKVMLLGGAFLLATGSFSCSDDDSDSAPSLPEPEGKITVIDEEKIISQNTPVIDLVNANTDVWLIARHSNASGEILGQQLLSAGNRHEISLALQGTSLNEGDTIYLMLYVDDGFGIGDQVFEEGTDDVPISGATETFIVKSPGFTISDPTVQNNTLIFDSVTVANKGWIVVYDGNPNDPGSVIVGYTIIDNTADNVVVVLNDNYTEGNSLFARLHVENQGNREFTFPDDIWYGQADPPEFFGFEDDNTIWMALETK